MSTVARSFPQMLQSARQMRGLSQSQLAERAGLDHSTIARFENRDREPSREAVLKVALGLGLDTGGTGFLLMGAGYTPESRSMEDLLAALFNVTLRGEITWDEANASFVIGLLARGRSTPSTSDLTPDASRRSTGPGIQSASLRPVIPARDVQEPGTLRGLSSSRGAGS